MTDISSAAGYEDERQFTIGSAVKKTFNVFGLAPGAFLILSIIPIIPAVIVELTRSGDPKTKGIMTGGVLIVQSILGYAIQAGIVYGAFREMRGGGFTIGEAVNVGLRRFFPILLASILSALIIILGYVALVVPGIIAQCALLVVIPVCTIERLGPVESLSRSAWLTKGSRWRILGALLLIGIPSAIVIFLTTFVVAKAGGVLAGELAGNVVQILTTAIGAIFVAVLYSDLRASKEGVTLDSIVSVFD